MSTYKKIELLNPLVEDEVLHPATTADLVKFEDGTTLDTVKTNHILNNDIHTSSAEKTKLAGIATGATANSITDYTATITTTWTGSAPYSQAITVSGILASDKPIYDIVPTGTYATDVQMVKDWSSIYRIVTSANTITVYSTKATVANIPITIKVVR